MQFNFEEIFYLIKLLLFIVGFLAFGIWYSFDTFQMTRFEGKIKKGIKIWSRELTYETWRYLSTLKQDIVEERKILFSKYKSSFIRKQDQEILIYSSPEKFSSTWVCVGYIDLNSPSYELEYRMSLAGIIFLLPFTIIGIGFLFFAISLYFYKNAIDSFIERKMNESTLQSLTFKSSNMETL